MKNQNKILMSLLTASVSALAAAPTLAQEQGKEVEGNYIDFKQVVNGSDQLTEEQVLIKNDIKAQVEAMLTKKTPIMKIGESINIVVENYAKDDETIKQQVFEELNLGATNWTIDKNNRRTDSTNPNIQSTAGSQTARNGAAKTSCHAICHTACHGACHGSRGWR